MAKGKILKSLVKKKPSGIKKSTPRYVKTASGMKLNPERFKQAPKAERLKKTKERTWWRRMPWLDTRHSTRKEHALD